MYTSAAFFFDIGKLMFGFAIYETVYRDYRFEVFRGVISDSGHIAHTIVALLTIFCICGSIMHLRYIQKNEPDLRKVFEDEEVLSLIVYQSMFLVPLLIMSATSIGYRQCLVILIGIIFMDLGYFSEMDKALKDILRAEADEYRAQRRTKADK